MRPLLIIFTFPLFTLFLNAQDKSELTDFDGFTNQQYALYLEKDGWNTSELNTAVNAQYLNDQEKNLILAMNLVRSDPSKFSELYVVPRFDYYDKKLFRFPGKVARRLKEGLSAAKELNRVLKRTDPLPILYPSKGVSNASADHARYMKEKGTTSHAGQGGMDKRVSKYGEWKKSLAENLQWGASNAHEAIISLLIDDGVPSRGHRVNMMNPVFTKVGVSVKDHPEYKISYVINYVGDFIEH